MNLARLLIIPAAVLVSLMVLCPLSAEPQSAADVDLQIDCGPNATYNQEYKVCFCDDGYHAGDDGATCVKDDAAKKESPAVKPQEPQAKPKEKAEMAEPAKKESPASAPAPAPRRRELLPGERLVRRGTTIKLQLIETVSSQTHKSGDSIYFKVLEEVDAEGFAIVDAGVEATGKVSYARPAKGWGKSGQLDIILDSTTAVDGTVVPLTAYMSDSEDWNPYAAGKTLASALIAGPLGLTIGGGMKGKKVVIDKGTTLAVFIADDIIVKSDKPATVKKSIVPTSSSTGQVAPPAGVDSEEQDLKMLKGCFEACRNIEGDAFKSCMNTCKQDCPGLCLGLEGADFTACLKKCAAPGE